MKQTKQFPRVSARFYEIVHYKIDDFPVENGEIKKIKYRLVTHMPRTTKTLRLYAKIRAWQFPRIYFKVEYAPMKTRKGVVIPFNDGVYDDKKEAYKALRAFLE